MFKRIFALIMAVSMVNLSLLASTPLERGTSLSVRITSQITSKKSSTASAIVENDVKGKNGKIVIKRGTPVQLQLNKKSARGCGKAGYVSVKCISTQATDRQNITLEGNISDEGENRKGLAIGLGVGLGLTVLPFVGLAFLAIKGQNAVIESNTIIPNVFVMNDYTIE